MSMRLFSNDPSKGYTISSDLLPEGEFALDGDSVIERAIVVPPGKHRLTIAYHGQTPLDSIGRKLWFRVESFKARSSGPASVSGSR